jgi:hypothetical protein
MAIPLLDERPLEARIYERTEYLAVHRELLSHIESPKKQALALKLL